jgi:hypothetical protein
VQQHAVWMRVLLMLLLVHCSLVLCQPAAAAPAAATAAPHATNCCAWNWLWRQQHVRVLLLLLLLLTGQWLPAQTSAARACASFLCLLLLLAPPHAPM